jgi:hypothetical protein
MTQLPIGDVSATIESIGVEIMVYDRAGTRQADGTWSEIETNQREIQALVFMQDTNKLLIQPPGEISGGVIGIHCRDGLYFRDAVPAGQGVKAGQSYVCWNGLVWRVYGQAHVQTYAGMENYFAVRWGGGNG